MANPHFIRIETVAADQKCAADFRASKVIDWNDSSDRKWLQNHTHWAMMNGASVKLTPESPDLESYNRKVAAESRRI